MAAAFGWGTLAGSSLVIGAIVALLFRMSLRVIGLIMGFGAGVLISAVAFDLVEEAVGKSSGHGWAVAGLFAGCGVFFGGDWLIAWGGVGVRMRPADKRAAPRSRSCSERCSTGSPSRW
jgi:zinc transporter, ZIP family